MILIVETYENADATPILVHEFIGSTRAECERIMRVHAKYDEFLRASLTTGVFHGITLTNVYRTAA